MNNKPFYELEGDGEDVYLYYYHDGKKNRYWLISKYINVLSVFGYSFEEMLCPQEMHIRSSLAGNWKWAWAECAHQLGYHYSNSLPVRKFSNNFPWSKHV